MDQYFLTSNQLEKQLQQSRALFEISQMLAGTIDLQSTLQQIADAASVLIKKAEWVTLHLLDESESNLEPVAVSSRVKARNHSQLKFRPGEGIAGLVLSSSQTILVSDVLIDPRYLSVEGGQTDIRSLLVAPVKTDRANLGTLSIQSSHREVFTSDDERLLTILGVQAAVAIEKARVIRKEREQRELAQVLSEISNNLSKTLDFDEVLDLLITQVGRLIPFDITSIFLVDDTRTFLARSMEFAHAIERFDGKQIVVEKIPELRQLIKAGKPHLIPNVSEDMVWLNNLGTSKTQSWIGSPVLAHDQVIAVFSVSKYEPRFYNLDHMKRLEALANQAALALQNARLFETLQKRLKEVNILYKISREISDSLDLDLMLQQVISMVKQQFGYYHVQIFLVDQETGNLHLSQSSDVAAINPKSSGSLYRPGEGVIGRVAKTLKPSLVNNVNQTKASHRDLSQPDVLTELAIPLKAGDHFWGVLDIRHNIPSSFSDHDVQLISTVADQIAVAIEKAQIYSDLQASLQHEKAARAQLVQSEKLAALGRIVASVAHELNNPLQAIQNALYLIKMEETLSPQAQEDMRTMLAETDRMTNLIARLREIYRPVNVEEFQPASINLLVAEVQTLLSTHLRHNNINFEFFPDENLPTISMLRDQMRQVLLNICLNAVEAMPDGGQLKVETFYQSKTREMLMTVSDTGVSINPHILPYIFDPFVTTKEGGTGLGLAITYDIVHRHNGRIEVETHAGKGTTIKIWIPIRNRSERRIKYVENKV